MKNERFQLCMLSLWPLTSFNFRNSPYVLGRIWTVTNFSAPLCVGGSSYETCFEGYKMFRVKVLIICCGFVGIFKLNSTFSVLLCILSSSMFFFLHTLYLFLSVLIVISGDVVHSPVWDRYSKISAENPERSFTQSQYKHEWKCVCSACVCLTIPQNHLTWKNVFIWNWLYWLYWYIQSCPYWLWWIRFESSFWCMYCSLICMTDCSLHSWPVPVALNEMCNVCFRKC